MNAMGDKKDVVARVALAAALFAAALVSIPALLLAAPALNFVFLQFVWRGDGEKPGIAAAPGNLLLAVEMLVLEITAALSFFALMLIVYARREWGMAAVAGAFFIASSLFARFDKGDGRARAREIAGRATVRAAAIVIAALLLLDRFFLFPFLLTAAAGFFAGVLSVEALSGAVLLKKDNRLEPAARRRLCLWAVALPLALYFSVMNLSALGRYRVFVPGVRYELKPSTRAGINSHGFRGPEFQKKKPRHVFRIAAVGDSATYGWLAAEPETWPRKLERELRKNNNNIEVVNAGVPSYSLRAMTLQFQDKLAGYEPDLLIVTAGANDARKFTPAQFQSDLEDYVDAAKSFHAGVVLCTYPYPSKKNRKFARIIPYNRAVRDVARGRGLPLFDAYNLMIGKPDLFLIDGHPNARGHTYLARGLAVFLSRARAMRPQ